jgi:predicted TPR repeat methyltransferase
MYIEKILFVNDCAEREVFDLGCGTGVCLELWRRRGYRVGGIDRSAAMLEVCRQRLGRNGAEPGELPLEVADMREFRLPRPVPVITSLYDTVNYLLTEEDLQRCFRCAFENLRPGGLFVFDLNTTHALRDEWGSSVFNRRDENIHSTWDNTFDEATGISTLRITLEVQGPDRVTTVREVHQERAYPLSSYERLLAAAGFRSHLYRHLTFQAATESDLRVMAVSRKP